MLDDGGPLIITSGERRRFWYRLLSSGDGGLLGDLDTRLRRDEEPTIWFFVRVFT